MVRVPASVWYRRHDDAVDAMQGLRRRAVVEGTRDDEQDGRRGRRIRRGARRGDIDGFNWGGIQLTFPSTVTAGVVPFRKSTKGW